MFLVVQIPYLEYDPLANTDDGSCVTLIVNGCTDSDYLEYDASANTDDGSCATLIVNGCTDSDYLEYDASANTDDGSCTTLIVNGCTDSDYLEYNASANTDDGSCTTLIVNGCIDNTACNYNDQANTDDDSCVFATGCDTCSGETDGTGTVINNDADGDGVCDADELAGCQDATACNFNALATDSDGLCIYTIDTCDTCGGNPLDGTGVVVNNDADGDGVCDADEVAGCQDATACNYNASATNDDSSCVFTVDVCDTCSGETDGTGVVVNNDADGDGICDADEVAGCQDATACNYNENATDDNGSCILPVGCDTCSGETDGTGVVINNDADGDGICDADEVAGCQDATACNYNENATDDDGSCILPVGCDTCSGETDGTGVVVNNDADGDGVCDADEVFGCTDPLYEEYDPLATEDDGSCSVLSLDGCTDPAACNYNENATDDNGSCILPVGCDTCSGETDGTGVVVNNDADGDGICDADEVAGCQDATACNYNENATDDDGSCILPVGCDTCSGETDGTGVVVNNDADGDGVCDADE